MKISLKRFAPVLFLALAAANAAGATPADNWAGLPVADSSTCGSPLWPKESLRRGHQGVSAIGVLVAADGTPLRFEILSSSGDPLLDNAAKAYISNCRFRPALAGGVRVERWMPTLIVWSIGNDGAAELRKLMRTQAERGDAAAQFALGYLLAYQTAPADTAEGSRLLRSAANLGHPMAQYQLGELYSLGRGVAVDLQQAREWYAKAAAQGNGPARDRVRDLGGAP